MSSSASPTIFDNAAGVAQFKLRDEPGIDAAVAAFLAKTRTVGANPRRNRELFFDPFHESQAHHLPFHTATLLAEELYRCGVLRAWTRLRCPDASEGENDIVEETEDGVRIDEVLAASCPLCGRTHGSGGWVIELIYAVNKTDTPDPFDLRRLGLGGALERGPSPISAAAMLAMEGGTAATLEVIEAVKVVLAANRPAMTYPSLASLLATETGRLVGAFLAFLGLMIIAGVILQQALFFALLMVGGWILWTIIGRKRAERVAVTRVEKTLSWGLTASVMGLLGKGMLGLDGEVGGEARSEFVLFGWSATLPCRFRTSEPSLQTCLVLLIPPVACGIALVAYKYIQGRQLTRELEVRRNASVS